MAARHFFGAAEKQTQRQRARSQSRPVGFDRVHQHAQGLQLVPSDRPLLTPKEACTYLGLSHVNTLDRFVARGLACIKFGPRCRRFDQADLDAWKQRHRQINPECAALAIVNQ